MKSYEVSGWQEDCSINSQGRESVGNRLHRRGYDYYIIEMVNVINKMQESCLGKELQDRMMVEVNR